MRKYIAEEIIREQEAPLEKAIGAIINGVRYNKDHDDPLSLTLKIGDENYTNFNDIVLSISPDVIEDLIEDQIKQFEEKKDSLSKKEKEKIEKILEIKYDIAKNTTEEDANIELFAVASHEAAHILFTSFEHRKEIIETIQKDLSKDGIHEKVSASYGAHLDNLLEDGRIERLMAIRYKGTLEPLRIMNTTMYENSAKYTDAKISTHNSNYIDLINGMLIITKLGIMPYNFDLISKENQDKLLEVKPLILDAVLANNPQDAMDKKLKVHECIKPLVLEHLREESKDMEQFEKMLDMLKDLLTSMPQGESEPMDDSDDQSNGASGEGITIHIEMDMDMDPQQGQQGGDEESNGEESNQGPGSGSSSISEEDEDKDEEAEKGKGSGSNDDESDKSEDGEKDDSSDKGSDKGSEDDKDSSSDKKWSNGKGSEKNGEWDWKKKKERVKEKLKEQKAKDKFNTELPRKRKEVASPQGSGGEQAAEGVVGDFALSTNNTFIEHERTFNVYNTPSELRQEITKLKRVVDEFYTKPTFNLRHRDAGILDNRSLTKLKMYDFNVFKRIGTKSKMDPVIMICWDGSGSMYGRKQYESARACAVIEGAFAEHIPMKIINFTTGRYDTEHYIVKDFDEQANKSKNFSYSYGENGHFGGGNNDGMSIKICSEELLARPERDKILIVLSDGMPTGYTHRNPEEDVKRVVEEAKAEGITVIPVFFGDKSFRASTEDIYQYMYKENIVNTPVEKITDALVDVFKKVLMDE